MDERVPSVRQARPSDAAELARIYIESWQDTYADILPHTLLSAMSLKNQTRRWKTMLSGAGIVLVAEQAGQPVGLASLGMARDRDLGMDGEIYTLYVDPAHLGRGTGRALMASAFTAMRERQFRSCLVWAHARNNACFFYESMGGKRIATRTASLMGEATPEICFGWKRLVTGKQDRPVRS